ncbi:NAD(P)H-quinone oxidoreductase [Tomitella fengzijianii]|uniref:NAD(P)H-quinone oxidoreductase n=1 Tax=Tomitella fengzijianii TaxID=2597660 RepID=A0A516WZW0_9ACTN|nr:NAD(P)H-quinone oxidoreductase [Tomitella fengzijianii]QDQ96389.1 NAD(P)H-quinone oxidoreductase [Tomitella fengzijianii]
MYAITLPSFGGPDAMRWAQVPDPVPGHGEVLVDVAASAVNRADLLQRQGHYPPPDGVSDVPGLECSGTIAELGAGVTGWEPGQRVCALLAGGGYAERVVVPTTQLMPVPDGVGLVDAAGIPEVACTVWSNVVMRAGLTAGRTLLVHGGSGGIGTHAIQVASALGATVATTAGSPDRLARCRELGAAIAVDHRTADFVAALREVGGADVILDNMGAKYLRKNLDALAPDGWLTIIGMQGGATGELPIGAMLAKRARVTAMGLRGRPLDGPGGKADIVREVTEHVLPMYADGRVRTVVHATVPMADAAEAHRLLESGGVFGKILLRCDADRASVEAP